MGPCGIDDESWLELKCVLVAWAERHGTLPLLTHCLLLTAVDLHASAQRIDYAQARDVLAEILRRQEVPAGGPRDEEDDDA